MKQIVMAIMLVVGLGTLGYAQEQKLSDVEQLKIQVLNLQYALKGEQEKSAQLTIVYGQCSAQALKNSDGLNDEAKKLQDEISTAHAGFDFDITTGKFTPKKK